MSLHLKNTYADQLDPSFYHLQSATPVADPQWAVQNTQLAQKLGLKPLLLDPNLHGLEILSGNHTLPHSKPLAQAYAGHQFGHFNILGDGRALLLGEYLASDNQLYDISLKGSGRTPYSRGGDGRAALGPMLREMLISEAMAALGIPTTRSLAVVTTGEVIRRDSLLPGALLTRIAKSHLRVGTFEFAAYKLDLTRLQQLVTYALQRHFPELQKQPLPALALLEQVMKDQAKLVAQWMSIGFIHGVMNTDNVSICGETIDYGPCAFMDAYHPETVFSSIDREGRYSYGQQPQMALWNLSRFANSLAPLIDSDALEATAKCQQVLDNFSEEFKFQWLKLMSTKIGILNPQEQDSALLGDLLHLMQTLKADYTLVFRELSELLEGDKIESKKIEDLFSLRLFQDQRFFEWHQRWLKRLQSEGRSTEQIATEMSLANPLVIPRNHLVEEALSAATESVQIESIHRTGTIDPSGFVKFNQLLEVLQNPFSSSLKPQAKWLAPPGPQTNRYQTFCGT